MCISDCENWLNLDRGSWLNSSISKEKWYDWVFPLEGNKIISVALCVREKQQSITPRGKGHIMGASPSCFVYTVNTMVNL